MLNGETTNTNFIVFGFTDRGSNPWPTAPGAITLTITSKMRLLRMNDNWLWTWRVPDEPAVVMLINAIDLVPLLVSVRAWIIRFFVRFIFIFVLLMLVMTWHRDKGRVTGWSSLMEKERLTLPEHRNSPPLFIWGSCCSIFNIPCSIIWIIVLSFCFFFFISFGHCTVCPCSNYASGSTFDIFELFLLITLQYYALNIILHGPAYAR